MEAIQSLKDNITVIVIAHRLNTIRNCDLVAFEKYGKLSAVDTYDVLMKRSKEFRSLSRATALIGNAAENSL